MPDLADRARAGYMFNIAMLKRVFAPTFILHDLKQTGEHEITTRWTMEVWLIFSCTMLRCSASTSSFPSIHPAAKGALCTGAACIAAAKLGNRQ